MQRTQTCVHVQDLQASCTSHTALTSPHLASKIRSACGVPGSATTPRGKMGSFRCLPVDCVPAHGRSRLNLVGLGCATVFLLPGSLSQCCTPLLHAHRPCSSICDALNICAADDCCRAAAVQLRVAPHPRRPDLCSLITCVARTHVTVHIPQPLGCAEDVLR